MEKFQILLKVMILKFLDDFSQQRKVLTLNYQFYIIYSLSTRTAAALWVPFNDCVTSSFKKHLLLHAP